MDIKLSPVESKHIDSHGHDPDTGTLRIKFKSGKTFDYSGVDVEKYDRFRTAESAGKFFHAEIRGQHEHAPFEEPKEEA